MPDLRDRLGIPDRELICEGSDGRRLIASRECSDRFVRHLEAVDFGTEGVRYRRLGVREQLEALRQPLFLELERHGELVGTYCLALTPLNDGDRECLGIYRAALSTASNYRGRGFGRWLAENALEWICDTSRNFGGPVLSWGCIERDNLASGRLLASLGAKRLGMLESMLVYRQWPKARVAVSPASADDAENIAAMLRRESRDHPARPAPNTGAGYVVLREGDRVIAGARATPMAVRMLDMGAGWNRAYRLLLRHSGAARRRFDPDNFRYVRLSDLYVTEEGADRWPHFVSALMATHGTHMAMFVLDPESPSANRLKALGLFGSFSRATRTEVQVVGQAWHAEGGWPDRIARTPLELGPLDF